MDEVLQAAKEGKDGGRAMAGWVGGEREWEWERGIGGCTAFPPLQTEEEQSCSCKSGGVNMCGVTVHQPMPLMASRCPPPGHGGVLGVASFLGCGATELELQG